MLCEESRRIRVLGSGATASPPPGRPNGGEERVTSGASWFLPRLGERSILLGTDTQASIHSSLE
eukprot:4127902-Prymnesium_polylepis.1